ncbi:DUF3560 domain-containing protein [Thermomonospora umbrina]|uniref:Uncharacterized protein DUF3560 n=1 Tax=Thermomonospora umbrina TaxID=111806 RepID=A0A3D9SGH7_9ACTN|nr:DUF3560 domain-containing protein [Thermomonospora umbrina]REE95016.1 uncharacterized protein DUF3560 [Thermomonospora umbrina]
MIEEVTAERKRLPLGRPHLIGHHSLDRTVRAEERCNAKENRGYGHVQRGRRGADRADAAAGLRKGRAALGTTLRRIQRLEADVRRHERHLQGPKELWEITVTTDWTADYGKTLEERLGNYSEGSRVIARDEDRNTAHVRLAVAAPARAVTESQITLLAEEIEYWKSHVTVLQEAQGCKVYSRDDFSPDPPWTGMDQHCRVRVSIAPGRCRRDCGDGPCLRQAMALGGPT